MFCSRSSSWQIRNLIKNLVFGFSEPKSARKLPCNTLLDFRSKLVAFKQVLYYSLSGCLTWRAPKPSHITHNFAGEHFCPTFCPAKSEILSERLSQLRLLCKLVCAAANSEEAKILPIEVCRQGLQAGTNVGRHFCDTLPTHRDRVFDDL